MGSYFAAVIIAAALALRICSRFLYGLVQHPPRTPRYYATTLHTTTHATATRHLPPVRLKALGSVAVPYPHLVSAAANVTPHRLVVVNRVPTVTVDYLCFPHLLRAPRFPF